MNLPPKPLRRRLLVPLGFAVCLLLVLASPLTLLVAAVTDLLGDRRFPTVRLVAFATVYALYDAIGLLLLLVLWVLAGAGAAIRRPWMQRAHYAVFRFWIRGINRVARGLFRLRIRIEDRPEPRSGPILVFSRHAGPGNSLMLVGMLMLGYRRNPRIVMLEKLQFEPFFDVIGNRLPNRFIRHDAARRERTVAEIAELAAGTGERDAFVLFPEGKDFTPHLRERAIASLRRKGHEEEARKADAMERVLPPRSTGVMAAVVAAPWADVVFVAHTVLEDIGSFRDLRKRGPLEKPVLSRYWRIPATEVPREEETLIPWLYGWWAHIDGWIDARAEGRDWTPGLEGRGAGPQGPATDLGAVREPGLGPAIAEPGSGIGESASEVRRPAAEPAPVEAPPAEV